MGFSALRSAAWLLGFSLFAAPSFAQTLPGTIAEPGSREAAVGDAILYFVAGKSLADVGGPAFNPFAIDGEMLLYTVNAFFVVTEFDGTPLHEGELSIYPQYQMPRALGEPSAEQPPIIPFAQMSGGTCFGGYVAGHPVPDTIYAVDMSGALCHADTVEQMVRDAYDAAQPEPEEHGPEIDVPPVTDVPLGFNTAFPTDGELSNAVYYAYDIAYAAAMADPSYFFWDGSNFGTLRDAIVADLASREMAGVTVLAGPLADPAATRACAAPGATELRIALTPDKLGITLTAASSRRYYSYDYDAAVSPEIRITEARDCATSGPGRAPSRGN